MLPPLLLLFCCLSWIEVNGSGMYFEGSSQQYIATIHDSVGNYRHKRAVSESQFIGDLIFNNTPNENGEVTISLCDITKSLFGDKTKYNVFNFDQSGGINHLVEAELKASLDLNIDIDGCLVFFFDPCCETVGVRFTLDDPVVFNAVADIEVGLEAFDVIGISAGTGEMTLDPLSSFHLGGTSPFVGSWKLPSILDDTISVAVANKKFCAKLKLPGGLISVSFCVELQNLTASIHSLSVCPRLTLYVGPEKIIDISYNTFLNDDPEFPECLEFSFLPMCSHGDTQVTPTIMQLFKSIDENDNYLLDSDEVQKLKALMGTFSTKSANTQEYNMMDSNADGTVDFTEFQQYTSVQSQNYNQAPYAEPETTFSQGAMAAAIIISILGTAIIVVVVLIGVAQSRGVVNIPWLSKVIPHRV